MKLTSMKAGRQVCQPLTFHEGNIACLKGSSINDLIQVGGRGCNFCDAMYEGLSKTAILAGQRGRGFRKSSN